MPASETLTPLRYTPRQATAVLGWTEPATLYALIAEGVFTVLRPSGKGRGKRVYLLATEVEAFAVGGRKAVAKLRKRKGKR